MNISLDKKPSATVLKLHEERLDAHNSQEFKDFIYRIFEEGSKSLVVDLSDVRFVDSSGLGALLAGHKNAGLKAGRFVLSSVQERVQSMFELTRLHRVFEIHPNVEQALAASGGESSHVQKPD